MKTSLLALAVLSAFVGAASAQSSVSLFGTIDVSGKYVKNNGSSSRLSMDKDGIGASQLGFGGVEDLGDGLKAGFTLLSSVGAAVGDIGIGQASNKFWSRRSTVSLFSNAGELRLGRDFTPSFWNQGKFDAFGTTGVGSSTNVAQLFQGLRQDNTIGYFLPPNLGGFYGQAMVAAGEGGTTYDRGGRYLGARVGLASGPFDIALAMSQQRFTSLTLHNPNGILAGDTQKTYNVGGSWHFGFAKLLAYYDHEDSPNLKENRYSISTVIPFGLSEIHVGYSRSTLWNNTAAVSSYSNTIWQAAATYQYNLSKRTALYGTVSRLDNGYMSRKSIASGASITAAPIAGGDSKGFELGIRHFF